MALVAPASFQGAICSFVCGFSRQRRFFKEKADLKPKPGAGNLPGTSLPKLSDLLILVFGYVKKKLTNLPGTSLPSFTDLLILVFVYVKTDRTDNLVVLRLVQVCCLPACEQGEGKVSENIQKY